MFKIKTNTKYIEKKENYENKHTKKEKNYKNVSTQTYINIPTYKINIHIAI